MEISAIITADRDLSGGIGTLVDNEER